MTLPPILAQLITPDPQPFISQYGPVLGAILIVALGAIGGGITMLFSKLNSATKAQDAVTVAFVKQATELADLRTQVAALSKAVDAAEDRDAAHTAELKTAIESQRIASEKAAALEREVGDLRAKVSQLERERAVRADELRRETERSARLETDLSAARSELTELRTRVAKLEGENSALHQVLDRLNVVSVKGPDPDPPPPTPPGARVIPMGEPEGKAEEKAA